MKVIGYLLVLQAMFVCNLNAQLCTGSLGDAVMNITFGGGSNPGPQLPAGQSSYTYSRSPCPNNGEYSVVNLMFNCFDNAWHTFSGDHTPDDAGGYYMLVNTQANAGIFFKKEVNGLCPNTTYEFATWFKNAVRPTACDNSGTNPNLTFTVETLTGTLLATYSTGEIARDADPQWKQYGMLYKTNSAITDVILKISNTSISDCGNAFAVDDVTLSPCGPMVTALLSPSNLTTLSVCEGNTRTFDISANYGSGFINPVFQWQLKYNSPSWQDVPGANQPVYSGNASTRGEYSYRLLIAESGNFALSQCRVASNTVSISVLHAPFVQATNYVYGCLKGQITLQASGANQYQWTGPNGFISTAQSFVLQNIKYSDAGLYKVVGYTNLGCVNTDSTLLRVYPNATATSSDGFSICEGTYSRLQAGGGAYYDWFPLTGLSNGAIANPMANPTESIVYQVKVTNQYGCADTAYVPVNVWKKPVANAGPDLKTRIGIPIRLNGSAKGTDVTWFWMPRTALSNSNSLTPVTNTSTTTTYTLNVVSPHGCATNTDQVIVKVYERILIPNAFSPNGDGINDTWDVDPLSLFEDAVTEVYNRNGQVVYRTRGYNTPWNGTSKGRPLPSGTYYYVIDLRVNREPKLTGSITILR